MKSGLLSNSLTISSKDGRESGEFDQQRFINET